MAMLEILDAANASVSPVYHAFLIKYKPNDKVVHGFVEGKDDPSFYQGYIENILPESWEVKLWASGNKSNVLSIFNDFEWARFPRNRFAFFIDRDLSEFINDDTPSDPCIYITDGYSIENEVVSRGTCRRVLKEVCNLSDMNETELDVILDLFENERRAFQVQMTPIMAWIIYWRRIGIVTHLNNIDMEKLFSFDSGKIVENQMPCGFSSKYEYIKNKLNISCNDFDYSETINEFVGKSGPSKYVRGKYELWFLVGFILSVYKNINKFSSGHETPPKMHFTLSKSNAITIFSGRFRMPKSLRIFLKRTLIRYAKEIVVDFSAGTHD